MQDPILFASAAAIGPDVDRNVEALVEQIDSQIRERSIDFALVFLSPHFMKNPAEYPTAGCGDESGQPEGLIQFGYGNQSGCACGL